MTHKLQEACQLFIEQEIQDGLKQGKTPYSIGKELAAWVERLFGTCIPPKTIMSRADKAKKDYIKTNITPTITPQDQEEIRKNPPLGTGPLGGRPQKYQPEKPKSTFNRTNDNIEWALWTWNPVTGCNHGCPYCYARDIAKRFYDPQIGFKPHFYPERINAPINSPIPKIDNYGEHNVFVCSMADLFGDWVPQEWIDTVFRAVSESPEWWNYIFLTKNPKKYLDLTFPKNCWIGATADTQTRADATHEIFSKLSHKEDRPKVLFLSMEPLSEKIILPEPIPYDWLIIGARSQTSGAPQMQPEWEWIESLLQQRERAGIKLYIKPNVTAWPKEYPNGK